MLLDHLIEFYKTFIYRLLYRVKTPEWSNQVITGAWNMKLTLIHGQILFYHLYFLCFSMHSRWLQLHAAI